MIFLIEILNDIIIVLMNSDKNTYFLWFVSTNKCKTKIVNRIKKCSKLFLKLKLIQNKIMQNRNSNISCKLEESVLLKLLMSKRKTKIMERRIIIV
jgi:hypothetical protein